MTIKKTLTLLFFSIFYLTLFSQENCSNGVDDDGDGLIDLNDFADCPCNLNPNIGEVTSLFPNPSFEDYTICPTVPNQINEANSWNQMTDGGPDYFNLCDPFSAIAPFPFPDGLGVAGFAVANGFLEYIGAPLTSPLVAGQNYRLDFDVAAAHLDGSIQTSLGPPLSSNISLSVYGNVSTTNFPIATTTGITPPAPSSTWELLGSVNYSPTDTWSNQTILFTAADNYQMIAIGPPVALPFDYINANGLPYFFIDQLILNEEALFGTALSLSGELCLDNSLITGTVPDPTTQWYFNGEAITGQTTDDLNVSIVGLGAGDYTLTINPASGCEYASITVTDNIYPTLDFTISDLCPPGDITFTSNSFISVGTIDSTVWQLQSNYSSTTATEMYATAGNYNVSLSAYSDIGCHADTTFSIAVEAPPTASFGFTPNCVGIPIAFSDQSTTGAGSPIATYDWDFGDNSSSSDQNPNHPYPDTLSYNVTLTVSTAGGCSDDTTMAVTSYPLPDANFTNTIACEGQGPISFTDQSSVSSGTIATLAWDFGDTGTAGNIPNPDHQYLTAGDYMVNLIAITDQGCTDTYSSIVSVSTVIADMTMDQTTGCAPLCVQFTDASSTSTGNIDQWLWSFSNGLNSSLENPNVCFNNPSTTSDAFFDVQLIVINNTGCSDTLLLTNAIQSGYAPSADFDYYPTEITSIAPTVTFTNLSTGSDSYAWSFGDESFSTDENPVYTFDTVESFEVNLVAITSAGCTDSTTQILTITPVQTIFVPNSFTPDEDGLNDLFFPVIKGAPIELYEFNIYDRNGHIIYNTEDPKAKWNGDYRYNKSYYTADGQYSWTMKIRFKGDTNVQSKHGTLYVIR